MDITQTAQPIRLGDGRVAVLFLHGFTGSPWSLKPWAEHVAAAGYRVSVPRLPGHGTVWQDMNVTGWRDWYSCAEREFLTLRRECDQVFVAGLSMGGALALRLAERHPDDVAGLLLVNPCVQLSDPRLFVLPLLRRLVPAVPAIGNDIKKIGADEFGYDRTPLHALASSLKLFADVRACLDLVVAPLILWRSTVDHVVPAASKETVLRQVSSSDITDRVLHDSYHVATLDNDAPQIYAESVEFLDRLRVDQPLAAS